jgi:hypothetical protein
MVGQSRGWKTDDEKEMYEMRDGFSDICVSF